MQKCKSSFKTSTTTSQNRFAKPKGLLSNLVTRYSRLLLALIYGVCVLGGGGGHRKWENCSPPPPQNRVKLFAPLAPFDSKGAFCNPPPPPSLSSPFSIAQTSSYGTAKVTPKLVVTPFSMTYTPCPLPFYSPPPPPSR